MYKTTQMMEEAVQLLGELSENEKVYVTGPHTTWLKRLEHEFKKEGLVDVVFKTVNQVCNGGLRGCTGVLLIDDLYDCTNREIDMLIRERRILNARRTQ